MHLFSRQFPSNISEMEFHHWLVFRSMNASLYREGDREEGTSLSSHRRRRVVSRTFSSELESRLRFRKMKSVVFATESGVVESFNCSLRFTPREMITITRGGTGSPRVSWLIAILSAPIRRKETKLYIIGILWKGSFVESWIICEETKGKGKTDWKLFLNRRGNLLNFWK